MKDFEKAWELADINYRRRVALGVTKIKRKNKKAAKPLKTNSKGREIGVRSWGTSISGGTGLAR